MLNELFKKPAPKARVNPRFRAHGRARIEIAERAITRADWERMWKEPAHPFPFVWGAWWKQCVEYKVDDFAAEVGFFIDFLGLPVNAFDPDYAMFTSPGRDFFIAVVPTPPGERSTPPDALRLQFMVADVFHTSGELERRGIPFEQPPTPCEEGSSWCVASFRTPHGIAVDLWGMSEPAEEAAQAQELLPVAEPAPEPPAEADPPAEAVDGEAAGAAEAAQDIEAEVEAGENLPAFFEEDLRFEEAAEEADPEDSDAFRKEYIYEDDFGPT